MTDSRDYIYIDFDSDSKEIIDKSKIFYLYGVIVYVYFLSS